MSKEHEGTPVPAAAVEAEKEAPKSEKEAPKSEKVYTVSIRFSGDATLVVLTTKTRKWARGCFELMCENGITCEVSYLAKPKPVKFKGH